MSTVATVLKEFYARLAKAQEAGGMLVGWSVEIQPTEHMEGQSSKPSLNVSAPTVTEKSTGSAIASPEISFVLGVSSSKTPERAGDVALAITQHADNIEALKNALERNSVTGVEDVLMGGLLVEPLRIDQSETAVKSDSFNTGVRLTMTLRAVKRGAR